jgi:hypothetical protein
MPTAEARQMRINLAMLKHELPERLIPIAEGAFKKTERLVELCEQRDAVEDRSQANAGRLGNSINSAMSQSRRLHLIAQLSGEIQGAMEKIRRDTGLGQAA